MCQRRYPRGLSMTLSSDYRELRRNYPERGIETTPAQRRLIVTWRWCAPPACHLAYSARPNRRGDSKEASWRCKFEEVSSFPRRRRDRRGFSRSQKLKRKRVRLSQTAGTLTCVACVYYPLYCRWSSEARRRIARVSPGGSPRSIRRRLRNPLSSTNPLRSSGAHRTRSRTPIVTRTSSNDEDRERAMGGDETKNKKAALACLLVFVEDCSVHVKHGPPTCRQGMDFVLTFATLFSRQMRRLRSLRASSAP